jgi:hypothetical protein
MPLTGSLANLTRLLSWLVLVSLVLVPATIAQTNPLLIATTYEGGAPA